MPGMTASIAGAPPGVLDKCSAPAAEQRRQVVSRHDHSRQLFHWLKSRPRFVLRGGPRDVICREPRRGRHGRRCYPGEDLDVPVQVGLVGVAAFCRYQGGAVTCGEAVCRMVERDQLGARLGVKADLGGGGPAWRHQECQPSSRRYWPGHNLEKL
jgi:hypothetical protein